MPLFPLAGGEIVLLLVSLRMARWLWRGWRALLAPPPPEPPEEDPPPGLPLEVLSGGREARPRPAAPGAGELLRRAA